MPLLEFVPDGNGDTFNWTGTPIGQRYETVQDFRGADEGASFVGSSSSGLVFLVTAGAIPFVPAVSSVAWVGVKVRAQRFAPGGPNGLFAARLRSSGADFEGSTVAPATAYGDFSSVDLGDAWKAFVDPATGLPWTWAAAVAAQVGLVDRTSGSHVLRCTLVRKLAWVEYQSRQAACRMVD